MKQRGWLNEMMGEQRIKWRCGDGTKIGVIHQQRVWVGATKW